MKSWLTDSIERIKSYFSKKFIDSFSAFFFAIQQSVMQLFSVIVTKKLVSFGIFIAVIGFALLFYFITPKKNVEKSTLIIPEREIKPLVDNILVPEEPGINQNFSVYQQPKSQWSEEDAKQWFVYPNGTMLEELRSANNTIVTNILGDAQ